MRLEFLKGAEKNSVLGESAASPAESGKNDAGDFSNSMVRSGGLAFGSALGGGLLGARGEGDKNTDYLKDVRILGISVIQARNILVDIHHNGGRTDAYLEILGTIFRSKRYILHIRGAYFIYS